MIATLIQSSTAPTGTVSMFAGSSAPSGWLLCDGSSQLRAGALAALFGTVGTAFGSVDGTHFNLPDLRGRAPIGVGTGAGLTARALAGVGGVETHALDVSELPSHHHSISANSSAGSDVYANSGGSTDAVGITGDTGGNAAHINMQPFLCLNFIIKT